MSDPIREKFDELTTIWMALPEEEFRSKLIDCVVPVKIMEQYYRYCLKDGLVRIEDLPQEKKRELFEKAKKWSPHRDAKSLITLCQVLWLRENIIEPNNINHHP